MSRWLLIVRGLCVALLVAPALFVVGCAPQPGTDAKEPAPPNRAAEAEAALDEAERSLQAALLRGPETESPAKEGQAPSPAMGGVESQRLQASRCSRACRALASMERSAGHLCELTGDDDARCQSARARVEAARRLVTQSCPECVEG